MSKKYEIKKYKNSIHTYEDYIGRYYCGRNKTSFEELTETRIITHEVDCICFRDRNLQKQFKAINANMSQSIELFNVDDIFYELENVTDCKYIYTESTNQLEFVFYNSYNLQYETINYSIEKTNIKNKDKNMIYSSSDFLYKIKIEFRATLKYRKCNCCGEYVFRQYESLKNNYNLGVYVFDDHDRIKLTHMNYSERYKNYNNYHNMETDYFYHKDSYIYNKDTKRIYEIKYGSKAGTKKMTCSHKTTIKDVTYSHYFDLKSNDGSDLFTALIIEDYIKSFGEEFQYTVADIEKSISRHSYALLDMERNNDYENNSVINLSIRLMFIKNYLNIKNTTLASFIFHLRKQDPSVMQKLKGLTEREIYSYFKVSKKTINSFDIDTCEIPIEYILTYKYIDDVSYLNSLLIKGDTSRTMGYHIRCSNVNYKNFFYMYCKNNSTKRIVNQVKKNIHYIIDSLKMYKDIVSKKRDYKLDFSLDVHALHDILSKDYNNINQVDKKITRDKNLLKVFNDLSFEDITYHLASNTSELKNAGTQMNICVGSYSEKAVKKHCYIAIGYDNENNPVTCIEINKNNDGYYVNQIKKKYNRVASHEEQEVLMKRFTEFKINLSYTADLTINRNKNESITNVAVAL